MKDQVIVVNGASAGVGRAITREFARKGYRLGLIARDPGRLEATRREVEELGGIAIAIPGDCSNFDVVDQAAERAEAELGPIDIWVNNAMVTILAPFDQISADEFRRVTEVTYLGTVHGTMAALARMKPRNHGTIIQVGSALAYRAIPLQSAYCGAKHAIRGFTDSLRSELLHDQSRVQLTMVHLPAVNTPQFEWCLSRLPNQPQPVPPIYQPEVAARAVAWAAEHRRREIWLGKSSILTILGNKLFPGLGDRFLASNGYDGQQTDQPVSPDRPNNLYDPVPGDQAARGQFSDVAEETAWRIGTSFQGTLVSTFCVAAAMGFVGSLLWRE